MAWVNVAAPGRGAGATATLRTVLGYVGAIPVGDACVELPMGRALVGPDGTVGDPSVRDRLIAVWAAVTRHLSGRE